MTFVRMSRVSLRLLVSKSRRTCSFRESPEGQVFSARQLDIGLLPGILRVLYDLHGYEFSSCMQCLGNIVSGAAVEQQSEYTITSKRAEMLSASSMSTLWIWRSLKAQMYALESTGSWSICKREHAPSACCEETVLGLKAPDLGTRLAARTVNRLAEPTFWYVSADRTSMQSFRTGPMRNKKQTAMKPEEPSGTEACAMYIRVFSMMAKRSGLSVAHRMFQTSSPEASPSTSLEHTRAREHGEDGSILALEVQLLARPIVLHQSREEAQVDMCARGRGGEREREKERDRELKMLVFFCPLRSKTGDWYISRQKAWASSNTMYALGSLWNEPEEQLAPKCPHDGEIR